MNKIGYVFILNNFSSIEQLKLNISTAISCNPMWIGIIHNDKEIHKDIITFMESYHIPFNIIYNIENIPDILKLDQFMSNYKNGWTIVNVVGEQFSTDKYDTINKIPADIAPIALVRDESESINNMCFFNIIYKHLKGSKCIMDADTKEFICQLFEEKVASKQPNMIKTWKDVYENHSHITSIK